MADTTDNHFLLNGLDSSESDGNTSFLRAARNGQLEKVLEHLKTNIDINTSNANGLNALHLASKDGHVEIVEELLKRGAIVDAATKKGNTALHIASLAGQEEVVKLLVQHGASVNVQSQNGFTPLYMAAQENHDNVVKFLLANGANQSLSTEDGFTPLAVAMQQGHDKVVTVLLENDTRGKVRLPALHIAAKKDDVRAAKLLLENDHNPDVTSKSGFTPLHIASHYGNQPIANLLIQKSADVNYSAKHNITPLHVAAKWGKSNMVSLLLEQGAHIEAKTRDGLTPLHCAARSGHEQVVDMLLEKSAPISSKTKNGLAPLHMAAQGDHVDAARILLYHRAPVDEVTVDYLTALHVAAHCGHVRVAKLLLDRQADANARALNGFTPLHIACKKNRIKVVELLLKHGACIGATTESGLTPLHVASFMGCMNIVIYLLQHDASPDIPTVRGETPLHLAARANQTDIIRILLRNGAQVDARAREQQTPLHIASRLGNVDIVMLLLQHGAKVDNTTKDMYTALHIASKEGQDEVAAVLIENGASLNATTKKGFTPLHLAAKYGHLKVAKLLLQKEAPVDAQGKNGVTPLHVASHYDHQNVALLLLEKGASPHANAKNGHTPLHIAARKNQMDIANTLLEYGAQPNAESKAGFAPLHLSAQEGHADISALLLEHKATPSHHSKNGLTPMHLCAQENKVEVAEILHKNGAELDAPTKGGYTPLHIACHYGQVDMVKFLLSKGANVKSTTSIGYTPLHQAAQQGHTNIVDVLLENSAQPNAVTNTGQTPLDIAQKLGYITVIDTLKQVTEPAKTSISSEEKYRVVAPEAMHETFLSDSEEEGEDTLLGDQTYRYLTADEMKSLGDDSLPIDVTRDERIDSNRMVGSDDPNAYPPRHIEDSISPEHIHPNYVEYIKKAVDNVDVSRHPVNIGFLVSFLVDARGGAMRGCRHSGVRIIVPPRCAPSPTRITCRYVRPQRTPHPPPLMEGEALASRVLELGPVGAKFLGPVIIEVPHFAALRGKEREIVVLRSDNGESWKEHTVEATEDILNEVLRDSFDAEELNQLEDMSSGRITRIITQDFPQYFAVISRVRQEVHAIGPEGGMVSSTVVPQVQAVFPQGALTKKIKVGLQAQPIDPELAAKLLGHGVAVSPVVTVEPRRRKFHKAITLSMPAPRAHSQGMINQYSGSAPTLRLLCSITGGTSRAQWEDVTGSTPLTFVNDCVSFTTTVSARFWLMDCRNIGDATKMATELYREAIHVPFIAKFAVFAKRIDPLEARLRVFCMTDDKEEKTLEYQEQFTEIAKSRDVEVLEGKSQYIEFAGNLVPITKSGEQLQFSFRAFKENRLPFSVRVKDQHAEAVSRCLFMKEPKVQKGELPQQPICILNIVLPDDIVSETISLTDSESIRKKYYTDEHFDYYRQDPRLADISNLLGDDWVELAHQLGLTSSEINVIKSEYPDSVPKQAQSMLRMWLSQSGNRAQTNTLDNALRRISREDIVKQCLNVDNSSPQILRLRIEEKGKQRLNYEISSEDKFSNAKYSPSEKDSQKSSEKYDKYSAEEKTFEPSDEEEDFNKTVPERREQIVKRLSVERTIPASSQRVEIVQEISSIRRQSLVEDKIAEVQQKANIEPMKLTTIKPVSKIIQEKKATEPSEITPERPTEEQNNLHDNQGTKISYAEPDEPRNRRDSVLLEEVTQLLETKKPVPSLKTDEDLKTPKFSKTPPPSPADFITKEKEATTLQKWDAKKEDLIESQRQPETVREEIKGKPTSSEYLVTLEDQMLNKTLDSSIDTFSFNRKYSFDTIIKETNAFIKSESRMEQYDPTTEFKCSKLPDHQNINKKTKKGILGSLKSFVGKYGEKQEPESKEDQLYNRNELHASQDGKNNNMYVEKPELNENNNDDFINAKTEVPKFQNDKQEYEDPDMIEKQDKETSREESKAEKKSKSKILDFFSRKSKKPLNTSEMNTDNVLVQVVDTSISDPSIGNFEHLKNATDLFIEAERQGWSLDDQGDDKKKEKKLITNTEINEKTVHTSTEITKEEKPKRVTFEENIHDDEISTTQCSPAKHPTAEKFVCRIRDDIGAMDASNLSEEYRFSGPKDTQENYLCLKQQIDVNRSDTCVEGAATPVQTVLVGNQEMKQIFESSDNECKENNIQNKLKKQIPSQELINEKRKTDTLQLKSYESVNEFLQTERKLYDDALKSNVMNDVTMKNIEVGYKNLISNTSRQPVGKCEETSILQNSSQLKSDKSADTKLEPIQIESAIHLEPTEIVDQNSQEDFISAPRKIPNDSVTQSRVKFPEKQNDYKGPVKSAPQSLENNVFLSPKDAQELTVNFLHRECEQISNSLSSEKTNSVKTIQEKELDRKVLLSVSDKEISESLSIEMGKKQPEPHNKTKVISTVEKKPIIKKDQTHEDCQIEKEIPNEKFKKKGLFQIFRKDKGDVDLKDTKVEFGEMKKDKNTMESTSNFLKMENEICHDSDKSITKDNQAYANESSEDKTKTPKETKKGGFLRIFNKKSQQTESSKNTGKDGENENISKTSEPNRKDEKDNDELKQLHQLHYESYEKVDLPISEKDTLNVDDKEQKKLVYSLEEIMTITNDFVTNEQRLNDALKSSVSGNMNESKIEKLVHQKLDDTGLNMDKKKVCESSSLKSKELTMEFSNKEIATYDSAYLNSLPIADMVGDSRKKPAITPETRGETLEVINQSLEEQLTKEQIYPDNSQQKVNSAKGGKIEDEHEKICIKDTQITETLSGCPGQSENKEHEKHHEQIKPMHKSIFKIFNKKPENEQNHQIFEQKKDEKYINGNQQNQNYDIIFEPTKEIVGSEEVQVISKGYETQKQTSRSQMNQDTHQEQPHMRAEQTKNTDNIEENCHKGFTQVLKETGEFLTTEKEFYDNNEPKPLQLNELKSREANIPEKKEIAHEQKDSKKKGFFKIFSKKTESKEPLPDEEEKEDTASSSVTKLESNTTMKTPEDVNEKLSIRQSEPEKFKIFKIFKQKTGMTFSNDEKKAFENDQFIGDSTKDFLQKEKLFYYDEKNIESGKQSEPENKQIKDFNQKQIQSKTDGSIHLNDDKCPETEDQQNYLERHTPGTDNVLNIENVSHKIEQDQTPQGSHQNVETIFQKQDTTLGHNVSQNEFSPNKFKPADKTEEILNKKFKTEKIEALVMNNNRITNEKLTKNQTEMMSSTENQPQNREQFKIFSGKMDSPGTTKKSEKDNMILKQQSKHDSCDVFLQKEKIFYFDAHNCDKMQEKARPTKESTEELISTYEQTISQKTTKPKRDDEISIATKIKESDKQEKYIQHIETVLEKEDITTVGEIKSEKPSMKTSEQVAECPVSSEKIVKETNSFLHTEKRNYDNNDQFALNEIEKVPKKTLELEENKKVSSESERSKNKGFFKLFSRKSQSKEKDDIPEAVSTTEKVKEDESEFNKNDIGKDVTEHTQKIQQKPRGFLKLFSRKSESPETKLLSSNKNESKDPTSQFHSTYNFLHNEKKFYEDSDYALGGIKISDGQISSRGTTEIPHRDSEKVKDSTHENHIRLQENVNTLTVLPIRNETTEDYASNNMSKNDYIESTNEFLHKEVKVYNDAPYARKTQQRSNENSPDHQYEEKATKNKTIETKRIISLDHHIDQINKDKSGVSEEELTEPSLIVLPNKFKTPMVPPEKKADELISTNEQTISQKTAKPKRDDEIFISTKINDREKQEKCIQHIETMLEKEDIVTIGEIKSEKPSMKTSQQVAQCPVSSEKIIKETNTFLDTEKRNYDKNDQFALNEIGKVPKKTLELEENKKVSSESERSKNKGFFKLFSRKSQSKEKDDTPEAATSAEKVKENESEFNKNDIEKDVTEHTQKIQQKPRGILKLFSRKSESPETKVLSNNKNESKDPTSQIHSTYNFLHNEKKFYEDSDYALGDIKISDGQTSSRGTIEIPHRSSDEVKDSIHKNLSGLQENENTLTVLQIRNEKTEDYDSNNMSKNDYIERTNEFLHKEVEVYNDAPYARKTQQRSNENSPDYQYEKNSTNNKTIETKRVISLDHHIDQTNQDKLGVSEKELPEPNLIVQPDKSKTPMVSPEQKADESDELTQKSDNNREHTKQTKKKNILSFFKLRSKENEDSKKNSNSEESSQTEKVPNEMKTQKQSIIPNKDYDDDTQTEYRKKKELKSKTKSSDHTNSENRGRGILGIFSKRSKSKEGREEERQTVGGIQESMAFLKKEIEMYNDAKLFCGTTDAPQKNTDLYSKVVIPHDVEMLGPDQDKMSASKQTLSEENSSSDSRILDVEIPEFTAFDFIKEEVENFEQSRLPFTDKIDSSFHIETEIEEDSNEPKDIIKKTVIISERLVQRPDKNAPRTETTEDILQKLMAVNQDLRSQIGQKNLKEESNEAVRAENRETFESNLVKEIYSPHTPKNSKTITTYFPTKPARNRKSESQERIENIEAEVAEKLEDLELARGDVVEDVSLLECPMTSVKNSYTDTITDLDDSLSENSTQTSISITSEYKHKVLNDLRSQDITKENDKIESKENDNNFKRKQDITSLEKENKKTDLSDSIQVTEEFVKNLKIQFLPDSPSKSWNSPAYCTSDKSSCSTLDFTEIEEDGTSSSKSNISPIISSPTTIRRTASLKVGSLNSPFLMEVLDDAEEISSVDAYIVTNPDESETNTPSILHRKPLFTLESEEEDVKIDKTNVDPQSSGISDADNLEDLLSNLNNQLSEFGTEQKSQMATTKTLIKTDQSAQNPTVDVIEEKLRDLGKALDTLEKLSNTEQDNKDEFREKKLKRIERKFDRMASEILESANSATITVGSPSSDGNKQYQQLVSQLGNDEVISIETEYSDLWNEYTFSKSDEWDSKTPDSQADALELPQGQEPSQPASSHDTSTLRDESQATSSGTSQVKEEGTNRQQPLDQHQLSDEMKELLKEMEKTNKQ